MQTTFSSLHSFFLFFISNYGKILYIRDHAKIGTMNNGSIEGLLDSSSVSTINNGKINFIGYAKDNVNKEILLKYTDQVIDNLNQLLTVIKW